MRDIQSASFELAGYRRSDEQTTAMLEREVTHFLISIRSGTMIFLHGLGDVGGAEPLVRLLVGA